MANIDSLNLDSVSSSLKQLQQLLDEARYPEAAKFCHKCLKEWPAENVFYRVKAFCEIQLSRWHSCLQTIGWLHGYRTHPAISDKPRKTKRRATANQADESRVDDEREKNDLVLEKLREATKAHTSNDACLWLHFEQSYCYYKLGKYNLGLEALSMCTNNLQPRELVPTAHSDYPLDSNTFSDVKSTLLKAQLCLRLGHFREASRIYANLKLKGAESLLSVNKLSVDLSLASEDKDEREDVIRRINRSIEDHLDRGNTGEDPYELYFNYACALLLDNDLLKAQDYLDMANEMLENELKGEEDDLDPEEQVEFANILAFRAFLNSKRTNAELASTINRNLLETFINSSDVDQATILVSLNNQLFYGCEDQEVPTYIHKIESLIKKEQISRKFSTSELNRIHGNCVFTYLTRGNLKECQRYLENFNRLLKQEDLLFFKSALMCVDGKVSKSIALLKQALAVSGNVKFVQYVVRLLLREAKNKEALSLLQEYSDRFLADPDSLTAYFLLLVKVHMNLNSPEGVYSSLKQLLQFHEVSANELPFRVGCKYLESMSRHAEALEVYRALHSRDKGDRLAQLGVLYNQSFTAGDQLSLPRDYVDSVVRDVRFIDAEELEADYKVTFHFEDQNKDVKVKVKKRLNRKRRNKKAQNPTGNPDPERWLHKFERASYKKQAKRRKDATKGLTQGSTTVTPSKPTTTTITANASKKSKKKKR